MLNIFKRAEKPRYNPFAINGRLCIVNPESIEKSAKTENGFQIFTDSRYFGREENNGKDDNMNFRHTFPELATAEKWCNYYREKGHKIVYCVCPDNNIIYY